MLSVGERHGSAYSLAVKPTQGLASAHQFNTTQAKQRSLTRRVEPDSPRLLCPLSLSPCDQHSPVAACHPATRVGARRRPAVSLGPAQRRSRVGAACRPAGWRRRRELGAPEHLAAGRRRAAVGTHSPQRAGVGAVRCGHSFAPCARLEPRARRGASALLDGLTRSIVSRSSPLPPPFRNPPRRTAGRAATPRQQRARRRPPAA